MTRGAPRPQLSVIDDPLRSTPSTAGGEIAGEGGEGASDPTSAEALAANPGERASPPDHPMLAQEPVKAVFARVPASLARRLEGSVFALRATRSKLTQQDVLAALLWRYVDHEVPAKVDELAALLDDYKRLSRSS